MYITENNCYFTLLLVRDRTLTKLKIANNCSVRDTVNSYLIAEPRDKMACTMTVIVCRHYNFGIITY